MSKIIFEPNQTTTTFWAASDEGDLLEVDWAVRPANQAGGNDNDKAQGEFIQTIYDTEKNYREVLALERSPFFDDIILTVHDYNFCIWKTSLKNYDHPIFRSSFTHNQQNTCGCWSPTRPGVIFVSLTSGIHVWDFLDQSHSKSTSLGTVTQVITFIRFQELKQHDRNQYLAFGEESDGTIFLYKVPPNLKNPQGDEKQAMEKFWDREISKCDYHKMRVKQREEEKQEKERVKAIEEAKIADAEAKEDEEAILEKELDEEEKYQEILVKCKFDLGLISEEELEAIKAAKKKKQR